MRKDVENIPQYRCTWTGRRGKCSTIVQTMEEAMSDRCLLQSCSDAILVSGNCALSNQMPPAPKIISEE